ncbi:hypothetical protein D5086_019491 [Populus alba]|uniref:Uncharacterized protein n=1 Tax=Populus alba TaxID=43335 RepID=A0ACC4BIQ7_POPAL
MLQTMKNHWWRMPKGKDDVSQAQSVAKIFGIPVTLSSSKKPCKKLRSHFLAHTAAAMRTLPTLTIFHRQPEYRQDQFAAKITMANHKYTPLQNTTASTTTTKAANTNNINNNDNSNMPIIFDSRDFVNMLMVLSQYTCRPPAAPITGHPLPSVFEEDCLSSISSLEDSTFKVGKLSVEQRKEKIHRYMKKRNERNFSKKIKYACRKTLADNRPRVRGRFAKNDDFAEIHRTVCGRHEEEGPAMKEEDVTDSDIFAHISGVKTFKCNYSIQSWS